MVGFSALAAFCFVIAGLLFPSPLVGEGGRDAKHRGRVRGLFPRIETPHPARTLSAPPSPTRGEGKSNRADDQRAAAVLLGNQTNTPMMSDSFMIRSSSPSSLTS